MEIESVLIKSLQFDKRNARRHDQPNLDAIRRSLHKFGQQKPIVVDREGAVIAGNGTLTAALGLGWKKIDVVRTELEGPDAVAFALADNRTAELAAWDQDIVGDTLATLGDLSFDIADLGFDATWMKPRKGEPHPAQGDPWGNDEDDDDITEAPDTTAQDAAGQTGRILLIYPLADYEDVIEQASRLLQVKGVKDMSQLFRVLLDENA